MWKSQFETWYNLSFGQNIIRFLSLPSAIRTSEASKNRDCWSFLFIYLSFFFNIFEKFMSFVVLMKNPSSTTEQNLTTTWKLIFWGQQSVFSSTLHSASSISSGKLSKIPENFLLQQQQWTEENLECQWRKNTHH